MPISLYKNNKGYFYRWGSGKRYYFNNPIEEKKAYNKALKQGRAIVISRKK